MSDQANHNLCLGGVNTTPVDISLPLPARRVLEVLENAGYEAWCVGGFVRDALLGIACADIDIATSASWETVKELFEAHGYRTHETGVAHGTITVLVEELAFEVTTYRSDGRYTDARHPDSVTFVHTIEEDLARRDFTINALAFHPERGLLDPYGGRADLSAEVLRSVGDANLRFSEDALRILRGCRFASQLGFTLDGDTYAGMMNNKHQLSQISAERITHELEKFLLGEYVSYALLSTCDVLAMVLPELVAMKHFEQKTPYHIYDVLEHTAHVIQNAPAYSLVRWAALFHDMGKPAAFFQDEKEVGHFYGHAKISVVLARGILGRLSISSAFVARVLTLVAVHDDVVPPTSKAVKRMLARLGGDIDLFHALCDLKRADTRAQAPSCISRVAIVDELEEILAAILEADEAFSLKNLAIRGQDVIAAGVPQGPLVGAALEQALDAVIDEKIPNEREPLLVFVQNFISANNA